MVKQLIEIDSMSFGINAMQVHGNATYVSPPM